MNILKKKIKEAISAFYRVQGGCGDNRSKRYITIENNEVCLDKLKPDSTLYIGDAQHMAYFLKKRLGIKGNIMDYICNHMDLQELTEQNVEVIKMYVPEWFKYIVSTTAVDQKNTSLGLPKLVDKSTIGDSFGISRMVGKIIKRLLLLWGEYTN